MLGEESTCDVRLVCRNMRYHADMCVMNTSLTCSFDGSRLRHLETPAAKRQNNDSCYSELTLDLMHRVHTSHSLVSQLHTHTHHFVLQCVCGRVTVYEVMLIALY